MTDEETKFIPPEAIGQEPTDPQVENEQVRKYQERVEDAFKNLESIELTDDKAVRIKLEGQEEIIYKSPKEIFISGRGTEEDVRGLRPKFAGIDSPLVLSGSYDLKFSDLNSSKSMAAFKKDINIARILATKEVHPSFSDQFAGTDEASPILRDEIFKGINDKDTSDGVRMFNFLGDAIIHGRLDQEKIDYFAKLQKADPKFMADFADFCVRTCLTTAHYWCFGLFKLLKARPELLEGLDDVHRDFSLPYLFERDYYSRWEETGAERRQKEDMKKKFEDDFNALGLNAHEIQQKLKELGSGRKYCPGFFEK